MFVYKSIYKTSLENFPTMFVVSVAVVPTHIASIANKKAWIHCDQLKCSCNVWFLVSIQQNTILVFKGPNVCVVELFWFIFVHNKACVHR